MNLNWKPGLCALPVWPFYLFGRESFAVCLLLQSDILLCVSLMANDLTSLSCAGAIQKKVAVLSALKKMGPPGRTFPEDVSCMIYSKTVLKSGVSHWNAVRARSVMTQSYYNSCSHGSCTLYSSCLHSVATSLWMSLICCSFNCIALVGRPAFSFETLWIASFGFFFLMLADPFIV